MKTEKTIFLTEKTLGWITNTTKVYEHECDDDSTNLSTSINTFFDRFIYLISEAIPELTSEEWLCIFNTYCGCKLSEYKDIRFISVESDIIDNFGVDDISDLSENIQLLVKKIHRMSRVEKLSILYVNDFFWINNGSYNCDFDEMIDQIILKISSF